MRRNRSIVSFAVAFALLCTSTSAQTTTRMSVASNGPQGNGHSITASISADGRVVAFTSQASNLLLDDTAKAASILDIDNRLAGYEGEGKISVHP